MSNLAFLGGDALIQSEPGDLFTWPIVTPEHEAATLEVLRRGGMSGTELTREFEQAYAEDIGVKYALACNNGTSAIHSGLFGLDIGVGDEVIVPSLTYWASVVQLYSLGATPIFAEVDPVSLCLDPNDIEHRITPRTKAILVVHYGGMPADMDPIMLLAAKHGLKVFEDGSHAHASLYKGKEVGTLGDASGFSLMAGKSFAIGEGGILFTNDQHVYEKAMLFGHYECGPKITLDDLKPYVGLPCGGYKFRMHQLSSAFGLVQLKLYRQQFAEIDQAMNYYCDLIDELPGITSHRPAKDSGSTKGGWYLAMAHYAPEELGGLSVQKFCEAVSAEGSPCVPGCNKPLHTHTLFHTMDVYGHGRPTRVAHLPEGMTDPQPDLQLPVTDQVNQRTIQIPWFKHFRPEIIEEHVRAMRKVIDNHTELLCEEDEGVDEGQYSTTFRR